MNSLEARWAKEPVLTIDGGLATEMEERGVNISDALWSARLLHSNPQMIKDIYLSFLRAGADIIITASYKSTVDLYMKYLGVSEAEARSLIKLSVSLAREAGEEYLKESPASAMPLIAGSIGPFGSQFYDELYTYSGNCVDKASKQEIIDWHRPRMQCLVEEGVDFICIETIAAKAEAEALVDLLKEFPSQSATLCFTCKNAAETCHGEKFADAAAAVSQSPQIIGVGVNCLAPQDVEGLLLSAKGVCKKPFIVYPNSGEVYKEFNDKRQWVGTRDANSLASYVPCWIEAGAKAIGGCCRTGPKDVIEVKAAIREYLKTH